MEYHTLVNDSYSGLRFRIHAGNTDFSVRLGKKKLTRETTEINILLDGIPMRLSKDQVGTWHIDGTELDPNFARALWNCITLRYRL